MTTDTKLPSAAVLDEAAAIVAAEWLRLTRDEDEWERELAEFLAELSATRRGPTRNGNATAALGRPVAASPPARRSATRRSRWPLAPTAWATQRSPPAATYGTTLIEEQL
ncbi:MAG: hypothetical protein JWR11_3497 [Mycobacterium sp.]|jgi:hypothetical protein|nr:hypothetical protein [Mycobacterium sp.]